MPDAQGRMIVDSYTYLMWYPNHIGEQNAEEALASKLIKLKYSGGEAYFVNLDLHSYFSKPETHWVVSQPADKVVVFGFQTKAVGVWVPTEVIAYYVKLQMKKWRTGRRSIQVDPTTWNSSIIA